MDQFLAAIAGALVGGLISMVTTAFFSWQSDLRLRTNRLLTLQYRVMESLDDIRKIEKHLRDSLTKDGKLVIERDKFCQHVLEMRGFDSTPISIRPVELAVFYKKRHNDLVQSILEIVRARNIAATTFAEYNTLKQWIDQEFVRLGEFDREGGELRLSAEFDPRQEKPLMGQIYKANLLIEQIWSMLNDVLHENKSLVEQFNEAPKHYFPFWIKSRKLEILPIRSSHDVASETK